MQPARLSPFPSPHPLPAGVPLLGAVSSSVPPPPHCPPPPRCPYGVLELLADGADDGQRLLQLGGQLVSVHIPQTQHIAHLREQNSSQIPTAPSTGCPRLQPGAPRPQKPQSPFSVPTPPPPRTPPVPPSPHPHLRDEGADLVLDLHQPPQAPFHDGGEVEQPQCVPGGRRVENHHREIHPLHQPGRAGGGRGGVQWGHLWGAGPTARPTLTSSPRRSSWPRRCRGRRSWLPASSSCPCSACCPPQRTRRGVPPLPGWGRSPGGGVVGFRGGLRGEGLLGWGSHGVGVP